MLEGLEILRSLRDTWSDIIPKKNIPREGTYEERTFKVRKNWFTPLILQIEIMKLDGYLSEKCLEEYNRFYNYLFYEDEIHNRKSNQKDITKAEELLNKIIDDLEGKLV